MESWRCVSGENEFLSEETNVCGDPLAASKHSSFAWDSRNPCNFSGNPFSTHQQIPNQGFGGLGSLEMIGKQELDSSIFDALSSKAENGRTPNPFMSSSTPFHRDESFSKLSVSVAESNSRDSPLIDLKLGRYADQWDARCNKFSNENQLFPSSEFSAPSKRVRASPVNSQPAFCQVLGCNKDLSSSKDYHKRHKVCDIHSKTATVIVNGIEQRFCQQCSRFHLLDAFDDGKRSCRKRLAGHNERRRKPQVGVHSGRSGRLLPAAYNGVIGSKFLGGGSNGIFLHPPAMEANLQSKPFFSLGDTETQFTPLTGGGTIFNDGGSHYPSIGGFNPMGTHEFDVFDAVSTVRSTGSALSLLSAQSRPWLVPMGQTSGVSNKISSSSAEGSQLCPVLSPDDGDAFNFEIVDGIFHGSSSSNGKDRVSSESDPTMNFLQLSSQLQRLEHQGKSMRLKRENNAVCCLRIT